MMTADTATATPSGRSSTASKVTGITFPVEETGRRAGDPPALVADSRRLGAHRWQPRHDDLEFIIRTAWEWEKKQK